jgi:protein-tyrosine phosphatase
MQSTTRPIPVGSPLPSPLVNLRGLGGLPVDGGRVREGVLWRSDDICLTTGEQIGELHALGLRAVIDLRSAEELRRTGRGAGGAYPIEHHHIPLTQEATDPAALAELFGAVHTPEDVGYWYARLFRLKAGEIVHALRVIAATDGGVLFHCAAGKDRTGILAAAVLSILGAGQETIIADYAATHTNIAAILRRLAVHRRTTGGGGDPFGRYAGHPMLGAHANSMQAMLETLEGESGMAGVLRSAGYDDALDSMLKARLVERLG